MARKTLAELKANPPKFTPDQRARIEQMSMDEIDAMAKADPDSPPMTDEQLDRAVAARTARLARRTA